MSAAATNPLPAGASLAGLYPFPTTNEVASNGTGSGNTIPTVTTMTSPPSSNGVNTLNFQASSDLSSLGLTAALPSESPSPNLLYNCLCVLFTYCTYYILFFFIITQWTNSILAHNFALHIEEIFKSYSTLFCTNCKSIFVHPHQG